MITDLPDYIKTGMFPRTQAALIRRINRLNIESPPESARRPQKTQGIDWSSRRQTHSVKIKIGGKWREVADRVKFDDAVAVQAIEQRLQADKVKAAHEEQARFEG